MRAWIKSYRWLLCVTLAITWVWSYAPALAEIVRTWWTEPEYSHGFVALPVAAWLIWGRRGLVPRGVQGVTNGVACVGLALMALSLGLRCVGAWYYMTALEGWSLLVWLVGGCVLWRGWDGLRIGVPGLLLLGLALPLPWRVETLLSQPLQSYSTAWSCWLLQCLGQPAIAEGNVILLDQTRLEVAQACSGLRLFLGFLAVGWTCAFVGQQGWWRRVALLIVVPPLAIACNALRVSGLGLLLHASGSQPLDPVWHDLLGWGMLPLAACTLVMASWYLDRLVIELKLAQPLDLARERRVPVAKQQQSIV